MLLLLLRAGIRLVQWRALQRCRLYEGVAQLERVRLSKALVDTLNLRCVCAS